MTGHPPEEVAVIKVRENPRKGAGNYSLEIWLREGVPQERFAELLETIAAEFRGQRHTLRRVH